MSPSGLKKKQQPKNPKTVEKTVKPSTKPYKTNFWGIGGEGSESVSLPTLLTLHIIVQVAQSTTPNGLYIFYEFF